MFLTLKSYLPKSIKALLKKLPFPLSKNQRYDLQTRKVIDQYLNENSNCIDVGCLKGEILDLLIDKSPNGNHFAFEPIPEQFYFLENKYKGNHKVKLYNMALSNTSGSSNFNHVTSNPSYSGLLKRDYDSPHEVDQQIEVELKTLDELIPETLKIDLIKIDVEGAEFLVMQGASKTIDNNKPLIIFEHGLGASEHYGHSSDDLFEWLSSKNMAISTLKNFLLKKEPFDQKAFNYQYQQRKNYYFISYPRL